MNDEITTLYTRLKRAGIAFLVVLIVGMTGYHYLVEGTSWFDGLYMTFLTVTTIGFAEVINLDDNILGRSFTILVALCGIGVLTYVFSNLAALIIESDIREQLKRKKMEKEIKKLRNHYLICGASQVGLHVADELEKTQRSFVIGDLDEEVVEELKGSFKYGRVLEGDCTEDAFLSQMNIEHASGIFITTRDDHHNIVICITARQLKPGLIIVSTCKESFNQQKLYAVGANRVISPSFIGGLRMASEMVRPTVTTFLDEMLRDTNRNLRIEEVDVPDNYLDKSILDLPLRDLRQTLVLAVREPDSWEYNPSPDYRIKAQSKLVVMTSPEELQRLNVVLGNGR